LEDVAALELTIIPNLSGGSYASLAQCAWHDQRLSDTARSDGSILQVMAQPASRVSFLSSFADFKLLRKIDPIFPPCS